MIGPYSTNLEQLTDISPYFNYNPAEHRTIFTGESLTLYIPRRFGTYGLQDVADSVNTLGIMDMVIDEKYHACLNILAQIEIIPTEIGEISYAGTPYLMLILKHGDVLINNTQVVKNSRVIYAVYVEFITRGKPLYTFDYDDLALVFDHVYEMTGSGVGVDRVMFELVVSHLARDASNLFKQYRYTDMSAPMKLIALRDVSYAPTSTTSRMIGSYFDNGLTSSLLQHTDQRSVFEDLLRGIPPEPTNLSDELPSS